MPDNILESIAAQGLLGLLLVGALITIYFLYKELKSANIEHLTDMKAMWTDAMSYREEIKNLIQNILDILRRGGDAK